MRISTFLVMVCVCCSYAGNTYSQTAKVNLHMNNIRLDKILNEIENQTDYLFVYNSQININQTTSVAAKDETVTKVLDEIFERTDINYSLSGIHIILTKKSEKNLNNQQQINIITGVIIDVNGEPIIGANVRVKNAITGTITDIEGNFSIEATPKSTIEISYIGYIKQELVIGNQKNIRIIMQEDANALDEIVVIGYGVQKKADLTGSVANISADKLNTQSNTTIGQALQGKIAGVDIVSQGGTPGADARIMIRGIGTLNNASPLFIVDGMYMQSMSHINPNNIASIDVLKDASSAAIYGSRAANGVIIVTTKSGSNTEGKPIVDVSANIGVVAPVKYLDMLNAKEFAEVSTLARAAVGKGPLEMVKDLENKEDNNWQDIMLNPALMQNYNVSVKGGGKYATYYASVGYLSQDGTMKGTEYERYTIQSKNDFKKGIFSGGINFILSLSNDRPMDEQARGGMLGNVLQTLPTLQKYDENRVGGYGGAYGDVVNIYHPLGVVDKNIMNRQSDDIKAYANIYAQIEFIKGLKYKINVTPDFNFYRNKKFIDKYDFGGSTVNTVTQLTERQTRTQNILIENLFSFDRTFGKHKISAVAGYTYQDSKYRLLQGSGNELPDGLEEIDPATADRNTAGNSSRSVLTSILGRVFYSFDNRYMITATLRRDGSSRFAKENRYGYFPSVSAGWNIAEESFMKNIEWLHQLKIRGGYGVLGNQEINNYQYSSTITTGINYPDGYGALIQGAFPKVFANPNIKWESTTMTNLGLDFMAFNGRLSLTADYYIKHTKDILLTVPIPISSGGSNDPVRNAGKIRNQGFEFNLGWTDTVGKEFTYGVNLLGSFNSNEVVAMGTGTQNITGGTTFQNIYTSKTLKGYPIGGFWLIKTDGYFANDAEVQAHSKDGRPIQPTAKPGDIRFIDFDNNGSIDDKDRVYCGKPFSDMTFSVNSNITYKNFDASITIQGVVGNQIYNATRQTLELTTQGTNYLSTTLDYWTPQNLNPSYPRLTQDDPNRNLRPDTDRYLENGSYLRLRSLQFGYTFPRNWFAGAIQNARIYANVENLFTITDYTGYSPDVNSSSATARGFDNFIYPNNRIFMLGLNLTF